MSLELTDPAILGKLIEGFGAFATNPATFVWNTVNLNNSTANKNIQIHFRNNTPSALGVQKEFRVRQLDDTGAPIGVGVEVLVGAGSTTCIWTKTNKNAQIQIFTTASLSVFNHMNTLK